MHVQCQPRGVCHAAAYANLSWMLVHTSTGPSCIADQAEHTGMHHAQNLIPAMAATHHNTMPGMQHPACTWCRHPMAGSLVARMNMSAANCAAGEYKSRAFAATRTADSCSASLPCNSRGCQNGQCSAAKCSVMHVLVLQYS